MLPELKPLALDNEGRSGPGFRRSGRSVIGGDSIGDSDERGEGMDNKDESVGVSSGVGD